MTGKSEAQLLMNELLGFAKLMLREHGEFNPFGGYLDLEGRVVQLGAISEGVGHGAQKESELASWIHEHAQMADACGIVTNVKMPEEQVMRDAVRIFLEARDGYCADVFFYYVVSRGSVEFNEVHAQQGKPRFF